MPVLIIEETIWIIAQNSPQERPTSLALCNDN